MSEACPGCGQIMEHGFLQTGVVLCQVQKAHRLLGAGKCRGRAGAGIPGKPVAENMVAAAAFCTGRMTDKKERAT